MVEDFNGENMLGGFSQNQIREFLWGFQEDTMNDIYGERG